MTVTKNIFIEMTTTISIQTTLRQPPLVGFIEIVMKSPNIISFIKRQANVPHNNKIL